MNRMNKILLCGLLCLMGAGKGYGQEVDLVSVIGGLASPPSAASGPDARALAFAPQRHFNVRCPR